jgi:RNA-binding protein YhbY
VPWAAARDEETKVVLRREKKTRVPTRAETELEAGELERLRRAARGKERWARAKKAGITDEVVEEVRGQWAKGQELAGVRIVEPLRRCMDRAREILEVIASHCYLLLLDFLDDELLVVVMQKHLLHLCETLEFIFSFMYSNVAK